MCERCGGSTAAPLGIRERRQLVAEAFEPVRSLLDGMKAFPAVQEFGNLLIESVDLFGECEAVLFQADKQAAIRGDDASAQAKRDDAMRAHELGLLVLARARRAVAEDESENLELDAESRRELELLGGYVRDALVDSPLKPSDASHVWKIWAEASAAGSTHELRDYIRGRADELDELRRSDTRGTQDNIPWWKVAAIAAIVGVAVWGVICCLFRVCGCPAWAMALANVVLAVAAWVLWYC